MNQVLWEGSHTLTTEPPLQPPINLFLRQDILQPSRALNLYGAGSAPDLLILLEPLWFIVTHNAQLTGSWTGSRVLSMLDKYTTN